MVTALYLELYFLAIACLAEFVAVLHLRAYWTWAQLPESVFDLVRHRRFVKVQMWCKITFYCSFGPALLIGIFHVLAAPGPLSLLPIPFYFLPKLILGQAKPLEQELCHVEVPDPAEQLQVDYIAYVWQHRLLPRF